MRKILVSTTLLLAAALSVTAAYALDASGTPVVVTPLASRTETASGQPITLPQKNVQVLVSSFEIAPGATLPAHKHPFPRYAYVQRGTLQVTNVETGKSTTYKSGDFIIEMIGQSGSGIRPPMSAPIRSSCWSSTRSKKAPRTRCCASSWQQLPAAHFAAALTRSVATVSTARSPSSYRRRMAMALTRQPSGVRTSRWR